MKSILHKAETRGHANHGWLNSYHTFLLTYSRNFGNSKLKSARQRGTGAEEEKSRVQ